MSDLSSRVRELRKQSTSAETAAWLLLRNRRILGLKFRHQCSLGRFVADFYCAAVTRVESANCSGVPLTRPAPAGESAGSGPPSPARGEGCLSQVRRRSPELTHRLEFDHSPKGEDWSFDSYCFGTHSPYRARLADVETPAHGQDGHATVCGTVVGGRRRI